MNSDYPEKDFNDEVYEDGYYEEHYDQEELMDDDTDNDTDADTGSDYDEDDHDEKGGGKTSNVKESVSYACEECDYRWDDIIVKIKEELDYDDDPTVICPMCGSMNCTQI